MNNTTNVKAYPLAWPKDRSRTKGRQRSRFGDKAVAVALTLLKRELGRMSASGIVVSTNIPLKPSGEPYRDKVKLPDPGVAVYFHLQGDPICLSCDRWDLVEDNLHAISKHVEAMRGMERWGVASLRQSFAGFKMLTSGENWWDVLGCRRESGAEEVQVCYRARLGAAHPDRNGGDGAAMARLNIARDQALAEIGGR